MRLIWAISTQASALSTVFTNLGPVGGSAQAMRMCVRRPICVAAL